MARSDGDPRMYLAAASAARAWGALGKHPFTDADDRGRRQARRLGSAVLFSIALGGLSLLAGCAGTLVGGQEGPPAAAPSIHAGDRWVYRGREGFRLPVLWEETHTVTAADQGGITIRVDYSGGSVRGSRTEQWLSPGILTTGNLFDLETRRFATPLQQFAFPLERGKTWNQWVDNLDETSGKPGQINRYAAVGGWEKVSTPAGTFDAIRIRVLMRLDDEEFWRGPTTCNYLLWYAPAVGATVREEREAEYWEKGERRDGMGAVRAQHTLLELVSFTRGS